MVHKLFIRVIHSNKLALRVPTLTAFLDKVKADQRFSIDVDVIDKYGVDDINMKLINDFIKLDNPNSKTFMDGMVKNIHVRQVAQCLKHYEAMQQFAAQDQYDNLLIIEDDVLFSDSVTNELLHAVTHINENPSIDVLFLGCPTPKSIVDKKSVSVKDVFKIVPTIDSYIVRKDAVAKLISAYLPIRFNCNLQFTFLSQTDAINAHMFTPNVFVNGSKYGVYISSTEQNNRLFMNHEYNVLLNLNTKTPIEQSDITTYNALVASAKFKEHPDFQYQFGLFHARIGQVEKAKLYFDTAFKVYNENDCVLSNESEFLLNYTRIFKFFQD